MGRQGRSTRPSAAASCLPALPQWRTGLKVQTGGHGLARGQSQTRGHFPGDGTFRPALSHCGLSRCITVPAEREAEVLRTWLGCSYTPLPPLSWASLTPPLRTVHLCQGASVSPLGSEQERAVPNSWHTLVRHGLSRPLSCTILLFQGRRMQRWTGTLTHWTCPNYLRLQKVKG